MGDTARVINEIAAERRRQIKKGYSAQHDDAHDDGSLALSAALLALPYDASVGGEPLLDQEDYIGLHMKADLTCGWSAAPDPDPRRRLVMAAAMLVAEIERRDRAPSPPTTAENSRG